MLLALLFALQVGNLALATPVVQASSSSRVDSVATIKFIARARREEAKFFYEWRHEWEAHRDVTGTEPRYWSLHCHNDQPMSVNDAKHLIQSGTRKSMCPIWFEGEAAGQPDESMSIDNGLRPDIRPRIRASRGSILRLLDSAAVLAPGDAWVTGQRVRLNVDQGDFDRAAHIASTDCRLSDAYCALLAGYVLASSGDRRGADAAFHFAVGLMTEEARCSYLDIRFFLEADDRSQYEALPCGARDRINARFWWLADPLFMQSGNERLAVHLYRQTLVLLHAAVTVDERFDWRARYGSLAVTEMILRYGWPSVSFWSREQDDNHFAWLRYTDSSVNASREYFLPRFHTTPSFAVATDISRLDGPDLADVSPQWNERRMRWDESWWPLEHIARDGPLGTFDYQVATFRRELGPLVALSTDPRSELIPGSRLPLYTAALVAMSSPTDSARRAVSPATLHQGGNVSMTLETIPGLQVVSAEFLRVGKDSAPAARARFAIVGAPGLAAMMPRDVSISDPALFAEPQPGDSLPRSAVDAIARMLPSVELRGLKRMGVFFEVYGLSPGEPTDLTLRIIQQDHPGLLRRIGARIGIGDVGDASILIRWRDDLQGAVSSTFTIGTVPVQARSIVVDLTQLQPGRYALEIGAARSGAAPALSRREFVLRK